MRASLLTLAVIGLALVSAQAADLLTDTTRAGAQLSSKEAGGNRSALADSNARQDGSRAPNELVLEAADCQADYDGDGLNGHQVAVTLSMRNLSGSVSGYQAFVAYDTAVLTYRGDLSSYSAPPTGPFPQHIQDIAGAELTAGRLSLDGSDEFGGTGTDQDALLATLVFDVDVECDFTQVTFDLSGPFPSELSFEGMPVATVLVDSLTFHVDSTDPVLAGVPDPLDIIVECDAVPAPATVTATDNCDGTLTVTFDEQRTDGSCVNEYTLSRTWTAEDACGNIATVTQTITVVDGTDPVYESVPDDLETNAFAGGCSATFSLAEIGQPVATDNCGLDRVEWSRSDAATSLDDPFAAADSPITITWTAYDLCGNTAVHAQTVTVFPLNDVALTVELVGVNVAVDRCIHFVTESCGDFVDTQVSFIDHDGDDANTNGIIDSTEGTTDDPATPVRFEGAIEVACGVRTQLCTKDEQHTLWDTSLLTDAGMSYTADTDLLLRGGDTDNDSDVDIHDVTYFLFEYGTMADSGGCPFDGTTRDADFSNNGAVQSEDYTFLTTNWLTFSSCACSVASPGGDFDGMEAGGPASSVAVSEVAPQVAVWADLNRDGLIDYRDVEEYEAANGLPNDLSSRIRATTARARVPDVKSAAGRQ